MLFIQVLFTEDFRIPLLLIYERPEMINNLVIQFLKYNIVKLNKLCLTSN